MSSTPVTSGNTRLVSLIGNPIRHSASPATHTLSFNKLGLDAVYVAFNVSADGLPAILDAMRAMEGWDGSNVTMPCKQAVIPYLDGLSDAAELMGAVNVIKKEDDGRLIGHNTDGVGFMENLRKHGCETRGVRMTLLGAGGAGSAVLVQAALDGLSHIDVFARAGGPSFAHARELATKIAEKMPETTIELYDFEDTEALVSSMAVNDILTNATNVGMGENCTDVPVPAELVPEHLVVADVIYLPRETQFIRNAAARGCVTVPGLGMMLEQAAAGEAIWFGVDMPTEEIAQELFA